MEKINEPFGIVFLSREKEETAFSIIYSATEEGWDKVSLDDVEDTLNTPEGQSPEFLEYLFKMRDEALDWLNQNCVGELVRYDYFEDKDEDKDEQFDVFGYGVFSREYLEEQYGTVKGRKGSK
jgi:hypothetical protein